MELIYGGGHFVDGKAGAGADLIYGGGKFFFVGSDITSALSRAVVEALTSFADNHVSRVAAEAIHESNAVRLSRALLEIVGEPTLLLATVNRVTAEVIGTVAFGLPSVSANLDRVVAEVLGYAAETVGKDATVTRAAIEVIASQVLAHRGLNLPAIQVNAVHIAYSIDLELTQPGFWGLQAANGDGYSLTWATASPATITETWRNAGIVTTSTFAAPAGRLVRQFEAVAGAGPVSLTDLASLRPDDRPGSGVLQEVMVWDRALTAPEATRIGDYLTCKWVTVACVPQISAPFPACVS
jgi:hypothetical protein